MPVCHEIDACAGLVRVHVSGDVTVADILGLYAALGADPALRPNLGVLADCRAVTSTPSFAELGVLADPEALAASGLRHVRAAVLVPSLWLFGIARQFGALVEATGVRITPFYDPDEANKWLAGTAETMVM